MLHNIVYGTYYEINTSKFNVFINNAVFNKIMICNNTLLLIVAAVYDNFDSPICGCMCVYALRKHFIATD